MCVHSRVHARVCLYGCMSVHVCTPLGKCDVYVCTARMYACLCVCVSLRVCTLCSCVHVCARVFVSVHTCTLEGNRAGYISTDAIGRCLFARSPEWIGTGKSMNGCG